MRVEPWKTAKKVVSAAAIFTILCLGLTAAPALAGRFQMYQHQHEAAAAAALIKAGKYLGRFSHFTVVLLITGAAAEQLSGTSTVTDQKDGRAQVSSFSVAVRRSGRFTVRLPVGGTAKLQLCGGNLCGFVTDAQQAPSNVTLAKE